MRGQLLILNEKYNTMGIVRRQCEILSVMCVDARR